jgi:tRNA(fMet)-specific endonuclease VapC
MSFVLDTDTCSAYLRGNRTVENRFLQYTGGLNISVVTLAELCTWVYRGADPAKRLDGLKRLLYDVRVLGIDEDIAHRFGQVDASLLDRGIVVATPDLLIAATALHHNFTIVTHNVRHFTPVPGLRVQDWLA